MRQPWQTGSETDEELIASLHSRIAAVEATNEAYNNTVREVRLINSRLSGEVAVLNRRIGEMVTSMGMMVEAIDYMGKFVDECGQELWDFLGEDGLAELKENVCIIERIED